MPWTIGDAHSAVISAARGTSAFLAGQRWIAWPDPEKVHSQWSAAPFGAGPQSLRRAATGGVRMRSVVDERVVVDALQRQPEGEQRADRGAQHRRRPLTSTSRSPHVRCRVITSISCPNLGPVAGGGSSTTGRRPASRCGRTGAEVVQRVQALPAARAVVDDHAAWWRAHSSPARAGWPGSGRSGAAADHEQSPVRGDLLGQRPSAAQSPGIAGGRGHDRRLTRRTRRH